MIKLLQLNPSLSQARTSWAMSLLSLIVWGNIDNALSGQSPGLTMFSELYIRLREVFVDGTSLWGKQPL